MPSDEPRALVVRAKPGVLRTYVLGFLAVSIPVFGVLYWYAVPNGSWRPVLAMQLSFLIIFAIGVWRILSIYTRVTATDVSGRGFLVPQRSIPLDSIDRVVLVPVYFGGAHERTTQFLALDADGKTLVRLRGQYWNRVDLDRVAEAIGKPVSTETVPLGDAEFFAEYAQSKYWFERNIPASIGIVAASAVGIFALTGAMLLITGLR